MKDNIFYHGVQLSYEDAAAIIRKGKGAIKQLKGMGDNFLSWLAMTYPGVAMSMPAKYLTEDLCRLAVKTAPAVVVGVPKAFLTENLLLYAIENAIVNQVKDLWLHSLPSDLMTDQVIDAYIAAGGFDLRVIDKSRWTPEIIEQALKDNISVYLPLLPEEEQTEERWLRCIQAVPGNIVSAPKKILTPEFCRKAVLLWDSFVYLHIPRPMRTEELAKHALTHRAFGTSVAMVLRGTPAAAKADNVLAVAYGELKKERSADSFSILAVSDTAGKVTDKKLAAYIEKVESQEGSAVPAKIPVSRAITSYTGKELQNIYERLYEMNLEGASEEYLEEYEQFAPKNCLGNGMAREDLLSALRNLTEELYNDLGNGAELKDWMTDCGISFQLSEFLIG